MLPVTHEQRQMIAPVMRWAIGAQRKRRNGVTEDGKENASVEAEVREQLRHEECGISSVQGRETRREMGDICENEDGAKVAPNMWVSGSHSQATLSPEFEECEKEAETEKERVKKVRYVRRRGTSGGDEKGRF